MQTIRITGTTGPIYRAVLRLIREWIGAEGLPDHIAVEAQGGRNRIIVTSHGALTRFISDRLTLEGMDWEGDPPSSCKVEDL